MRNVHIVMLMALVLLSACGGGLVAVGAPRGTPIARVDDASLVREALARALTSRRFTIESEEDKSLVVRYERGRLVLRLRIDYDDSGFQVSYVDSEGLAYRVDPRTQQAMISPHYRRHVINLERTVQSELERPAQEAREAEEIQRRHELAVQQAETDRQLAIERERAAAATRSSRAERRERRRARWAEAHREQQATERERLRAEAAASEARAEELRRQPPPVFQGYHGQPIVVERFAFEAGSARRSIVVQPHMPVDPVVVRGASAGRIPSASLGLPESCPGFWTADAQHTLVLQHDFRYLRVEVASDEDTTLAIVTPEGYVYCDDDSAGGHDPRLAGQFPAGTYAVYVGTYRRGGRARYAMQLSEQAPAAVAAAPVRMAPTESQARPAAPPRERAPDCRSAVLEAGHSPSYLSLCEGANPWCAAELVRAGHSPSYLPSCRGVDAQCAVTLLRNGQSPSYLPNCR